MGSSSKIVALIFVVVYAYLIYLVFSNQGMMAMYVMAIGMFAEAGIGCWYAFKPRK